MIVVDCSTLDEFWEAMSPIGKRFGARRDRFIFRGQSNSEWKLVPRVFRTVEINKYKLGLMAGLRDHPGQFFFEWALLHGFMCYCDAAGLSVPGDSMEFRAYFEQNSITSRDGTNTMHWPEERVVPLMAMAQHHGVPTRLLDWSSNPYVACYHAAATTVIRNPKEVKADEKIAIFGLNVTIVGDQGA